jgi:hypothetical protein
MELPLATLAFVWRESSVVLLKVMKQESSS